MAPFHLTTPTWTERSRVILLFLGLAVLFALARSMGVTSEGSLKVNDAVVLTKQRPLDSPFEVWQRIYHFGAFYLLTVWMVRGGRRNPLEFILSGGIYIYLLLYISAVDTPADALLLAAILLRVWLPVYQVALLIFGIIAAIVAGFLTPGDSIDIFGAIHLTKSGIPKRDDIISALFTIIAPSLFAWISFELFLRLREGRQKLQQALRELRESRGQELRHLALEERAQLSRELHDTIGHHLTALNLHAQRAQLLAGQTGTDERIQADLAQIRAQGGEVVRGLAEVVQTLRDPAEGAGSLSAALMALCSQWPVTVHLILPDPEPALSAAVRVTLYRACQEALTNAAKHAPGEEVHLEIMVKDDLLTVTARNRLASVRPQTPSGQGLRGLGERLEQLGGHLDVRQQEGDYLMTAQMPTGALP